MAFSCLIAAARTEEDLSTPKCCVMTRAGGCTKEASKYKFHNLISKFELYNLDPPVLKEGQDGETARICRDHHRLPPKKYQDEERPTGVVYESAVAQLEREDRQANHKRKCPEADNTSESEEEWDSTSDENKEVQDEEPEQELRVTTTRTTRNGKQSREKTKEPNSPPATQERHCIYLKVEDDEKCRAVAQKLGLARGPNGYNRSALLAKVPVLAAENNRLREQVLNLQLKVDSLEQDISASERSVPCATQNNTLALAPYDEISSKLSNLKKEEEPSWVELLMKNLTEEEIIQIVHTYNGGRLREKILRENGLFECDEQLEQDSEVPNSSPLSAAQTKSKPDSRIKIEVQARKKRRV
jgi:hypothetical protein